MAKISINLATGSLQQEEIIVGIDLGTTNSLVAFINPEKNPQVINDAGKGVLVPSVIHFNEQGDAEVGNEAKAYLTTDPTNTIFSVKRLLGRSYKDVAEHSDIFSYKVIDDDTDALVKIKAGDKFYTPIELSAEILKELKARAEHALKTPVNRAVITVPAYFNDSQRQATRDAGKLAGLDVLRIVNEPTAASLAYGLGLDPSQQKTIAVYDLGGGTFDVSILQIQNGIFEVLSTNGNTFLGGDDFDRAIFNYWVEKNQLDAAAVAKDNVFTQSLRLQAEAAKKALTTQNLYNEKLGDIWCTLDKQTFESLIAAKVQETIEACQLALTDASLSIADIDEVVLVGGSTRTPYVKKAVSEFFGKTAHDNINPDEVVALGAAVQADILAGNRSDILLLDEPTNHMDLPSIKWLETYLNGFDGAIVIVSHDRYFLDNVANKIWFIEEEKIKQYPGTYAEYEEWDAKRVKPAPKPIPVKQEEKKPKVAEPAPANVQQQLKKLNDKLKRVEEEIATFENSVKACEAELAKEEIFSNAQKLQEANQKYQSEKALLDAAQQTWETLAGEIMELEG